MAEKQHSFMLQEEAAEKGKVDFITFSIARRRGEDPKKYEERDRQRRVEDKKVWKEYEEYIFCDDKEK